MLKCDRKRKTGRLGNFSPPFSFLFLVDYVCLKSNAKRLGKSFQNYTILPGLVDYVVEGLAQIKFVGGGCDEPIEIYL